MTTLLGTGEEALPENMKKQPAHQGYRWSRGLRQFCGSKAVRGNGDDGGGPHARDDSHIAPRVVARLRRRRATDRFLNAELPKPRDQR